MKQRQYAQHRLSVGIAITLPMLNIDEATGKRLIDFFIYRGIFFIFTLGF
jgi:hypothetical protein